GSANPVTRKSPWGARSQGACDWRKIFGKPPFGELTNGSAIAANASAASPSAGPGWRTAAGSHRPSALRPTESPRAARRSHRRKARRRRSMRRKSQWGAGDRAVDSLARLALGEEMAFRHAGQADAERLLRELQR